MELEIFLLVLHGRTTLPFYMRGRAASLADSVYRRPCRMETRSERGAPIFLIMIYAKFTKLDGGFPLRNGIYDSAYSCVTIELWMHLGGLLRSQGPIVALGYASSDSYASFVFSNLLRACITWWSHVYHLLIFSCFMVISLLVTSSLCFCHTIKMYINWFKNFQNLEIFSNIWEFFWGKFQK